MTVTAVAPNADVVDHVKSEIDSITTANDDVVRSQPQAWTREGRVD